MNHIPLWASHFNITEKTSLKEALKNQIPEKDYFRWASLHYQTPCFSEEYFHKQPPLKLWNKVKNWTDLWNSTLVPIEEWNNILYVGCLEPPHSFDIQQNKTIVFILAPVQQLENLWKSLNSYTKKENDTHKITSVPEKTQTSLNVQEQDNTLLSQNQDPPSLKIKKENQHSPVKNETQQKTAHTSQETINKNTFSSSNHSQTSHSMHTQKNDDFIIENKSLMQNPIMQNSFSLLRKSINIFQTQKKTHTTTISKASLHKKTKKQELNNTLPKENKKMESTSDSKNTKENLSSLILTQNTNPVITSSNLPIPEQTQPPEKIKKRKKPSPIRIELEQTKTYAKSYILFVFKDKYFIPWKWSFDLKPKNKTSVSIKHPSLFRIAYHSQKPYFGYVPPVTGNHEFFDQWGLSLPEQIVFIPLINSNKKTILGGYLGLLNKDQSSLDFLKTILQAVEPLNKFCQEDLSLKKAG